MSLPSYARTALAVVVLSTSVLVGAEPARPGVHEVSPPSTPRSFDGDLRDLPQARGWRPGEPIRDVPQRLYRVDGPPALPPALDRDPLVDRQLERVGRGAADPEFIVPTHDFGGLDFSGVNPPDTVGDVGPNHYIQSVNTGDGALVRIFDKVAPVPNEITTFFLDTLGQGVCTSGFGDPIVLYDRQAGRWLLTEFSSGGNGLCVYVSQTGDPVSGGWHAYTFQAPTFPDYPKYAVWATDANGGLGSYVVTANDGGPGIYALDRGQMLDGNPATFQRIGISGLSGFGVQGPTPAEPDGADGPPAGDPAIIMRHRDTEIHGGPNEAPGDVLEFFEFQVDWQTPANTTLTQLADIDVADFSSHLCGNGFTQCFDQPTGGANLMPIQEVIYNRLQYYNHGTHRTLVGSYVVDVDDTDHGGVRWFELRNDGTGWFLNQEGTYSIDAADRWMASIAMDQSGNIALAYSTVSEANPEIFNSLRYTGRLADDAPGVMTQPETVLVAGSGANSSFRNGDYSALTLDPEDDCTFWFTGMNNFTSNWRTHVGAFRFEACGCESEPPLPPVVTAVNNGDNRVDVGWDDSAFVTNAEYRVRRATTPGGPYETIATVPDSSPGVGGGASYLYSDTTVSGGITYYYIVVASDGGACRSSGASEASVTATGQCLLAPSFAGVGSVSTPNSGICTLDVSWSAAAPSCAGPISYNVYRSSDPQFTPSPANLLASGVIGESLQDVDGLVNGVSYTYVVRAVDGSNGIEEGNEARATSAPFGLIGGGTPPSFVDDAGDSSPAQLTGDPAWSNDPAGGNEGPAVYAIGDYPDDTCAHLETPTIAIGSGDVLTFWSRFDIEPEYDKGIVEISIDGGANFEEVPVDYPDDDATQTGDECGFGFGPAFTGSGSDWVQYTGDLGAWAGNDAILSFSFSTDASVNRSLGWVVDDIAVQQAAGECATGSSCVDNPFVDVTPSGDLVACQGLEPELSVVTSGGSGPFLYQWSQDGVAIPGATEPSFVPTSLGTHTYNVRVRSTACSDEVFDGVPTTVTIENRPYFDGLLSAVDPQGATCGVQLDWDPASSSCPGPLSYDIYRSAESGVTATLDNLLVSGFSGTSYLDQSGVDNGNDFFYLVRAVDQFNLNDDGNTVERSATPTGPNSGTSVYFSEDFSSSDALDDWEIATGPGAHTCGNWAVRSSSAADPANGSGNYAAVVSDADVAGDCGLLPTTSASASTPPIDLDLTGTITNVTAAVDVYFDDDGGNESAKIAAFGNGVQVLWVDPGADLDDTLVFDVTNVAAGSPAFELSFDYQNGNDNGWLSIDDLTIEATVENACATGTVGPAPAPDGRLGTTPLRGDRLALDGSSIRLQWDVTSCTASDYNLLYGSLGGVSSFALDGSACGLGTSGSFDWSAVPTGDLFILIVGTDGAGTESSWGLASGGERNGASASGECGTVGKDATGNCF